MGTLSTSTVAEIQRAASHVAPPRDASLSARARRLSRFTLAVPIVVCGAAGVLALTGNRERRALALSALGGALGLGFVRWQLERCVSEQAQYSIETSFDDFEVRQYAPTVRAETTVRGAGWGDALRQGFECLAGYAFGNNRGQVEVSMIAPVLATVGQSDASDRVVSFIMPARYGLSDLPAPNDARVQLRVAPGRRVASLRFRGSHVGELPARKRAELLDRVRRADLTPVGEVLFAGYDAPSTLPLLRRNEVLVEVL